MTLLRALHVVPSLSGHGFSTCSALALRACSSWAQLLGNPYACLLNMFMYLASCLETECYVLNKLDTSTNGNYCL